MSRVSCLPSVSPFQIEKLMLNPIWTKPAVSRRQLRSHSRINPASDSPQPAGGSMERGADEIAAESEGKPAETDGNEAKADRIDDLAEGALDEAGTQTNLETCTCFFCIGLLAGNVLPCGAVSASCDLVA